MHVAVIKKIKIFAKIGKGFVLLNKILGIVNIGKYDLRDEEFGLVRFVGYLWCMYPSGFTGFTGVVCSDSCPR